MFPGVSLMIGSYVSRVPGLDVCPAPALEFCCVDLWLRKSLFFTLLALFASPNESLFTLRFCSCSSSHPRVEFRRRSLPSGSSSWFGVGDLSWPYSCTAARPTEFESACPGLAKIPPDAAFAVCMFRMLFICLWIGRSLSIRSTSVFSAS